MTHPLKLHLQTGTVPLSLQIRLALNDVTVVDFESDNMRLVMSALLLALGYRQVQFDEQCGLYHFSQSTVLADLATIPCAVFVAPIPDKGVVTLTERYSEELEELRIDVTVDGNRAGSSVSTRYNIVTFQSVLHNLGLVAEYSTAEAYGSLFEPFSH